MHFKEGLLVYPGEFMIDRISNHTCGEYPDYPGRIYFLLYRWMGFSLGEPGWLELKLAGSSYRAGGLCILMNRYVS